MNRLQAGYRMRDVDGRLLRGIPSEPTPQVVLPGPAQRTPVKNARTMPQSIRYVGSPGNLRYRSPSVQGLGNRQRNVLPADVWYFGNRYNKTAVYAPPVGVANPTWRIANVTTKEVTKIEKLQQQKRQRPPGR